MEVTNTIRMRVLADGTTSISTDAFEEEMHLAAENLINETVELLGGDHKIVERKNKDQHTHTHQHGHGHVHN